jgi:hypothetical protein
MGRPPTHRSSTGKKQEKLNYIAGKSMFEMKFDFLKEKKQSEFIGAVIVYEYLNRPIMMS